MRRSIQRYFGKILSVLVDDLSCNNPSVRIAAAKVLLAKILPDLKATELTGKDGKSLDGLIRIVYENNKTLPLADSSGDGPTSV